MSSTIPQLTLFPLYPGGPLVRNTGGALNANSSFYTQATAFTPAYGVNTPPQPSTISPNNYLVLNNNQTLGQQPVSNAQVFNRNLGFDGTVTGGIKGVQAPAVAPNTPVKYQDIVALYAISDLKFTDLMNQPDFRIPGIGMGVQVTTDGLGNVDTIALNPSSRGVMGNVSTLSPFFAGPKMAEITEGATFKAIPDPGLGGTRTDTSDASQTQKPVQETTNPVSVSPNNPFAPINAETTTRNAGLFKLDALNGKGGFSLGPLAEERLNPVLERLLALQPPEAGQTVFGPEASANIAQSRQMAVNQAGLDIAYSPQFRENVTDLVSATQRQQESVSLAVKPQMPDGRMPTAPAFPNTAMNGATTGFSSSGDFNLEAAVSDAMNRKSSGGYLPMMLRWQAPGMEGGNAGSFGGSQNPFSNQGTMTSGGQTGQGRPQRRPLAFMA